MQTNQEEIREILSETKKLAKRYKRLTGKPLGITGEVAEFTAATLLNLHLSSARQEGYDAVRIFDGQETRIQIKGRSLQKNPKPGQRLGAINLKKEWDTVVLVLLDEDYEPIALYEAMRDEITKVLLAPGSKSRNERGAMSVSKFKSIGKKIWPNEFL